MKEVEENIQLLREKIADTHLDRASKWYKITKHSFFKKELNYWTAIKKINKKFKA